MDDLTKLIRLVPGATIDIPTPFNINLRSNAKMPKNEIHIYSNTGKQVLVVNLDTGEIKDATPKS